MPTVSRLEGTVDTRRCLEGNEPRRVGRPRTCLDSFGWWAV